MLIVLHGGLGNQVFQVSVGAALAQYTEIRLTRAHTSLGTRSCEVDDLARHLGLHVIDDPCPRGHQSGRGSRVLSDAIDNCCGVYYPGDGDVDWAMHNTSPKSFLNAVELAAVDHGASLVERPDVVMIHLRLGDYLWPRAAARYGILKEEYYLQVLSEFQLLGKQIWLVAEDRRAVKRLYPRLWRRAANIEPAGSAWQDLLTLSSGTAIVSANSTFSLWAAWLGAMRSEDFSAICPLPLLRTGTYRNFTGAAQWPALYLDPRELVLKHPWVLTRRLGWQGRGWI